MCCSPYSDVLACQVLECAGIGIHPPHGTCQFVHVPQPTRFSNHLDNDAKRQAANRRLAEEFMSAMAGFLLALPAV